MRASSTKIRTYLSCARRAVFEFGDHPVQPSEAMAIGTVTHGILELRFAGKRGTRRQIEQMRGNYDDPVEALRAHPDTDIYGIAKETADVIGTDVRDYLNEFFGSKIVRYGLEFDLESREITMGESDAIAGGYLDGIFELEDGRIVVWDWKTRGRLDYIPRTQKDFLADYQLCYYAAAVAHTWSWVAERDSVFVGHGNLLRANAAGGPKSVPVLAEIPTWYLESAWTYFGTLADEMAEVMARPAHEVPRNPDHCYTYGPCPHMKYCQTGDRPRQSFVAWAKSTNLDHLIEGDA